MFVNILKTKTPAACVAVCMVAALAACGDDDGGGNNTTDGGPDSSTDDGSVGADGSVDGAVPDGSNPDGGSSNYPALPTVFSLSGCAEYGLGPLCAVTQDEGAFEANCGGRVYTGTIAENGDLEFATPTYQNEDGADVTISCSGRLQRGAVDASCSYKATATETTDPADVTCDLVSDAVVLPDVSCLALPSSLSSLTVCKEGAENEGETIAISDCAVIQDGCNFQANCAGDIVLTGSTSAEGASFNYSFKALADAQTPEEGEPAFVKGDVVSHSCVAALDGTALVGECGAGRVGRGGSNTSVCSVEGTAGALDVCQPLSNTNEQLFVLNSCEILENGEGGVPGIGEPICAFRQNNCVWEVNCGSPLLTFTGKLAPNATKAEWKLLTGTPCEASFDAQGNMTGKCTVAGEESCALNSKEAVPGGEDCPTLAPDTGNYKTRGCGDGAGDGLDCRVAVQHGCSFAAICGFRHLTSNVISGVASYDNERGHLEFSGVNGFSCFVDEPTAADIETGDREANEWYGDCTLGDRMCRNNWNPETREGFRGLQLFVDVPDEE